jgi:hypothetical protein
VSSHLRDRPTADLVVLFLSALVAVVLVASVVGGIVWKVTDPDADLADLAARIGDITNTLIGAIVGYLAGKGTGAAGALRETRTPPPPSESEGGV